MLTEFPIYLSKIVDPELLSTFAPPESDWILIRCGYNEDVINLIKEISGRVWVASERSWAIRFSMMRVLMRKLRTRDVCNKLDIKYYLDSALRDMHHPELPENFEYITKPYSYQEDAVKYGLRNPRFILGDEQGCLAGDSKVYIKHSVFSCTDGTFVPAQFPGSNKHSRYSTMTLEAVYRLFESIEHNFYTEDVDGMTYMHVYSTRALINGVFQYIPIDSVYDNGIADAITLECGPSINNITNKLTLTTNHQLLRKVESYSDSAVEYRWCSAGEISPKDVIVVHNSDDSTLLTSGLVRQYKYRINDTLLTTYPADTVSLQGTESAKELATLPDWKGVKYVPDVATVWMTNNEENIHTYDIRLFSVQIHNYVANDIVVHNCGKALTLDTLVYTPEGPVVISQLEVGDRVIGSDGQPTIVTGVYDHKELWMNEIHFDDGSVVHCCEDHQWRLDVTKNGERYDTVMDSKTLLREMLDANFHAALPALQKPVLFQSQRYPISPEIMAMFLASGEYDENRRCLSVYTVSGDLFDVYQSSVRSLLEEAVNAGYIKSFAHRVKDDVAYYDIFDLSEDSVFMRIADIVSNSGQTTELLNCYLYNNETVRHRFLSGFLNVCAYRDAAEHRYVIFHTSSVILRIIHDVASSLCYVCKYESDLILLAYDKGYAKIFVQSVHPADTAPGRCISVSSEDELYLMENYLLTHNTKEIIDIARACRKTEKLKRVLIICGVNGNKYNWYDEVHFHSEYHAHILGARKTRTGRWNTGSLNTVMEDLDNLPNCMFLICNIEKLRSGRRPTRRGQRKSISEFPVVEKIQKLIDAGEIGMVVVDEIHKCKSPTSQQSQALLWLTAPRMIGASGTVVIGGPVDLYVPLKWLQLEFRKYYDFQQRFCVKDYFGSVVGYQNVAELMDVLHSYQLRRLKKDILDLPEKIHTIEYVELTSAEVKVYGAVEFGIWSALDGEVINPAGLKKDLFEIDAMQQPITVALRLRQAVAATCLVSDDIDKSSKLDRMEELIEDMVQSGEKCIVFSMYSQVVELIRARLSAKKYKPAVITGEVSQSMRVAEMKRFQTDDNCKCIVGTVGAMGTGYTLTAATNVIFVDEPWTMADKMQCEDRAHRVGTKSNVNVITIMARDTVDERIHQIVENKGDVADMVVDGVVNPRSKSALIRMLLGPRSISR